MCLIIVKQKGKTQIPKYILDNAENRNPHGFGIVFLDGEEDDLRIIKTTDYEFARELVEQKRPFVAHYRFATKGATNQPNCHPFSFNGNALFSNGTVEHLGQKLGSKTDTEEVADILTNVPQKYWGNILRMASRDVRFAIVDKDRRVHRFGDWHKREGVLYSKDNCFYKPYKYQRHTAPAAQHNTGFSDRNRDAYQRSNPWDDDWFAGYCKEVKKEVSTKKNEKNKTAIVPFTPDTEDEDAVLEAMAAAADRHEGVISDEEKHLDQVISELQEYYDPDSDTEEEENDLFAFYGELTASQSEGFDRIRDSLLSGASFIGEGQTAAKFRMVKKAFYHVYHGESEDEGSHVRVELYSIPKGSAREELYRLQDTLDHTKELIEIEMEDGGTEQAWLFFSLSEPSADDTFITN